MRRAAVLSLRWRDVDFDTGLIRVRQQVQRIQDELHISPVKSARARPSWTGVVVTWLVTGLGKELER